MIVTLTGNYKKRGGVVNFPLFLFCRTLMLVALLLPATAAIAQSSITAKVYRKSTSGKYYGKIYIPKGSKYYVDFHPAKGVTTGVYSAYIDGENIYLQPVTLVEGRYMIDATSSNLAFVVRSTSSADIVAKTVSSELSDWMDSNEYYYYDATDARRNALRYATTAVSNASLRADYPKKHIYVMANPARNDLAFTLLDHRGTTRDMPQNSLYIVSRKNYDSARLNIVWIDEPDGDVTDISEVERMTDVVADDAIYTLQGVRVEEPLKRSLYIRNGRKYVAE